jgi:hypothetical protein
VSDPTATYVELQRGRQTVAEQGQAKTSTFVLKRIFRMGRSHPTQAVAKPVGGTPVPAPPSGDMGAPGLTLEVA